MTDDRTETITDPAEIRATDEPDERTPNEVHVDESGCSCKTGPYRGFQRDPIDAACPKHGGPLRHGDGDVTVCHPDGSTTIIREPDERGDFPCCTTPAPASGAGLGVCGYALTDSEGDEYPCDATATGYRWYQDVEHEDLLDVACEFHRNAGGDRMAALVAEVRRLTVEAATQREWFEAADAAADRRLDQSIAWMERAEAAEAEVRRLTESRATVAANLSASLMLADAEVVTLRAKVAAVESLVRDWPCSDDTCDGDCTGCAYASDLRAALAITTGEGQ